jgi:hypothetical protein
MNQHFDLLGSLDADPSWVVGGESSRGATALPVPPVMNKTADASLVQPASTSFTKRPPSMIADSPSP